MTTPSSKNRSGEPIERFLHEEEIDPTRIRRSCCYKSSMIWVQVACLRSVSEPLRMESLGL